MSYKDYYPMGAADDPNAPYNQQENKELSFDIYIEYSLAKSSVNVTTCDYGFEMTGEEYHEFPVVCTDETDWEKAYNDSGHFTIVEMLNELKEFVQAELPNTSKGSGRYSYLMRLLDDCQGWTEELTDIGRN